MLKITNELEDLRLQWDYLREGNEEALFFLYKSLYNPLFNYGFVVCGERESVEDAINQVFLEIWENKSSLKPVQNVKSYLFTYLRRKIGREKAIATKVPLPDVEAYEHSILDYIVELQLEEEMRHKITLAINKLTARQKQLIMLRFYEDMNYEEISAKTGLVTQTVYNNIHQAIKLLRIELKVPVYILLYLLKK